jgi:hypothetical protein
VRDDVDVDAGTITFVFEELGRGVVVVPLFTYNCRAFRFVCGVHIADDSILLLFDTCLDLFNVLVDNEDDCVLSNKFDRSNNERGTRILVSDLDILVVSTRAKKNLLDKYRSKS